MIAGPFSLAICSQSDKFSSILTFVLSEMACFASTCVHMDGSPLLELVSH